MRWAVGGVSCAAVIAGAVGYGPASTARADVAPGTGGSYAQSLQVTPHEGSLAVGVVMGEALPGPTNSIARAQSQAIDLGAAAARITGSTSRTPPPSPQPPPA